MATLEENLEEKSFNLGLFAQQLPPEPESINREYYNLGLEIFHIKHYLNENPEIIMNFRKTSSRSDNPELEESLEEGIKRIVGNAEEGYKRYLQIRKEHPEFFKGELNEIDFGLVTRVYNTLRMIAEHFYPKES